ncbi:MAG: hypothetical protein MK008_01565 [Bdellovibrionales bacterium]|nr:hypothetical protein [Bdellovibrionales bacterium]
MKAILLITLFVVLGPSAQALTCKDIFTVAHFKPKNIKSLETEKTFKEIIGHMNERIGILETLIASANNKVVLSTQKYSNEEFLSKVNTLNEALGLMRSYRRQIQTTYQLYGELLTLKSSRGKDILNSTLKAYIYTKNALLFPQVAESLNQRHNQSIELYKQVDLILNGADYLASSFNGLSRVVDMFSSRILELSSLNKRNSLKQADLHTLESVISDFVSYKEVLQHMVFKNYTSVQAAVETLQSSHTQALKIINFAENKKDRLIERTLNHYLETRSKFPYVEHLPANKLELKSHEKQDIDVVSKILAFGVTPSHIINNKYRLELLSDKSQEVFIFELPHRSYIDHKKQIEDPLMFFWSQTNAIRFPKSNGSTLLEQNTAASFKKLGINESNFWMYFDLVSAEAQFYFLRIAQTQLAQLQAIESL